MSDNIHIHNFHDDHHHDNHRHHHHGLITDPEANTNKIFMAGVLQVIYVLSIGVVGIFYAHSAALTSDAAHVLADSIVSFASVVVIRRSIRPANKKATFGYKRLQVRMAEWNGLLFFVLATYFATSAIQRLVTPGNVKGVEVVVTGLISLPLSGVVFWLSHSASKQHEHNHKGKKSAARFAQELHALNDLMGVAITIVGGFVIWIWGFDRADAIATLFVVASMLKHGFAQLKQTGWILLEQAPASVDVEKLSDDILSIPDVIIISEIHVWCINEETTAMNIRIICANGTKCHKLQRKINHIAEHHYKISIATIQVHHEEDVGRKD